MMNGDQIYADDVAGPMLRAIHGLIARLGLFDEYLEGAVVSDSASLYGHHASYYHRADLLLRWTVTRPCANAFRRREEADLHQQHRRQSPGDLCRSDRDVPAGLVASILGADRARTAAAERARATTLRPRNRFTSTSSATVCLEWPGCSRTCRR